MAYKKLTLFLIVFFFFSFFSNANELKEKKFLQRRIKLLAKQLYDKEYSVRAKAMFLLGEIGSEAISAFPEMVKIYKNDKHPEVVSQTTLALSKMGQKGMIVLLKGYKTEKNVSRRAYIVQVLANTGEKAVPPLTEILIKDKATEVKAEAAWALGQIGSPSFTAMPVLISTLRENDNFLRDRLLNAIEKIGEKGLPFLIQNLKTEKNKFIKCSVAGLIGHLGPKAALAVPALIEALQDKDYRVRANAALTLSKIGSKADFATPALMKAMEDGNHNVKFHAISAIGSIGSKASAAIPQLISLLRKREFIAAWALGEMGEKAESAIPALIKALKDSSDIVRYMAAEALGKIKKRANLCVTALISVLQDSENIVREKAIKALLNFGSKAKKALPFLIKISVEEKNPRIREVATKAMNEIKKRLQNEPK